MGKAPEKPKKYEDRLMDVFSFDEDDLDANQAGQFSRRQLDRLNSRRNSARYGGALLGLLGLMTIAIVLPAIAAADGLSAGILGTPLLIGIILAGIWFGLAARARKLTADLHENRAAEIEGRVELVVGGGRYASYSLRVDKLRFPLKQKAFLAFKNGDPYRIYYAPHSKKILSVEWLRENDNPFIAAESKEQEIAPLDAEVKASESDQAKRAAE